MIRWPRKGLNRTPSGLRIPWPRTSWAPAKCVAAKAPLTFRKGSLQMGKSVAHYARKLNATIGQHAQVEAYRPLGSPPLYRIRCTLCSEKLGEPFWLGGSRSRPGCEFDSSVQSWYAHMLAIHGPLSDRKANQKISHCEIVTAQRRHRDATIIASVRKQTHTSHE